MKSQTKKYISEYSRRQALHTAITDKKGTGEYKVRFLRRIHCTAFF